jgi:predicted aspartyl protease
MRPSRINYLFIILFVFSCKTVKLPETKTIVHEGQIDSLIIDSKKTGSFVNANINGKDIQLLLDTGASRSALKGLDLIGGEKGLTKDNHLKDQQIGTASGSVETILYSADSLNLNAVTHRNYTCYLLNTPQMEFNCNSGLLSLNSKGVLGMNVFFDTDKALFLNYKDQYLELLDPENLNLKGYQEIEAEFNNNNTISVETIINGEKYDLLLDSGATEFVILNENPFKSQDQKLDMKSLNMLANGLKPSKVSVFKNVDLQLSGLNLDNNIITVYESLDVNALGFKFMKNYNWILDLKNEKVYIKKSC